MRDTNPERELLVWESIAQAYEAYVSTHSDCDNKDVCLKLSVVSTGGRLTTENEYTEELRALWLKTWGTFATDPEAKFRETCERLKLGEE